MENKGLLWAVYHDDVTLAYMALMFGASPVRFSYIPGVTPVSLFHHLGERHDDLLQWMVKYVPELDGRIGADSPSAGEINLYYAVVAEAIAQKYATGAEQYASIYEAYRTKLSDTRYIKAQLRKALWQATGDRFVIDGFDDDFEQHFTIDSKLEEAARKRGVEVVLPQYDESLVSRRQYLQIFLEACILVDLEQNLTFTLPARLPLRREMQARIPGVLENTLLGRTLQETDYMMKIFGHNSIYVPQDMRKKLLENWKSRFVADDDGNPTLRYAEVERIYVQEYGGIDLRDHVPAEMDEYQRLQQEEMRLYSALGYRKDNTGRFVLDHGDVTFHYHDNLIVSDNRTRVSEGWTVTHPDGVERESYNPDFQCARYLTEVLPQVPVAEYRQFFALLDLAMRLYPIAKLLKHVGIHPDFSELGTLDRYETEAFMPPLLARNNMAFPTVAAEVGFTGTFLFGGVDFSGENFGSSEIGRKEAQEIKKAAGGGGGGWFGGGRGSGTGGSGGRGGSGGSDDGGREDREGYMKWWGPKVDALEDAKALHPDPEDQDRFRRNNWFIAEVRQQTQVHGLSGSDVFTRHKYSHGTSDSFTRSIAHGHAFNKHRRQWGNIRATS